MRITHRVDRWLERRALVGFIFFSFMHLSYDSLLLATVEVLLPEDLGLGLGPII